MAALCRLGWSTQDVLSIRPHLTDNQAWDVLARCQRFHDGNYGFTWTLLELEGDNMYPAPVSDGKEDAQ